MMTRLQQIRARHANWQERIEADIAPHYETADEVQKLKIEIVLASIQAKIGRRYEFR